MYCFGAVYRLKGSLVHNSLKRASVTVNNAEYRTILDNFLRPAAENHQQLWFQHDGAHTARDTMALLRDSLANALFHAEAISIGPHVHRI